MITGIEFDIIAIKQVDNLTVIQASPFDIVIKKQIDSVTIRDIEEAISQASTAPDNITIVKQADSLTITKPPTIELTIKD